MQCWHMSGAGNDFMVIDARGLQLDFEKLAMELCETYGCDGFLAVDNSKIADFKLHFYNPDGLRGEMCGNGARCICRFAYDNGVAPEKMTIETDAGLVPGVRITKDRYLVQLNNPSSLLLDYKDGVTYVEEGDPGIPHGVKEIPDLTWDMRQQLLDLALQLRNDTSFPKGINVNFYRVLDDSTVRILTYERGVEDYTLACGTGSAAVALELWARGQRPGGTRKVENPGGTLLITVEEKDGKGDKLLLDGPTEVLKIFDI